MAKYAIVVMILVYKLDISCHICLNDSVPHVSFMGVHMKNINKSDPKLICIGKGRFTFLKNFNWCGVVMLVSAIQHSESVICVYMCVCVYIYIIYIHISTLFSLFFRLFSCISHYRVLSKVPCALW